MTLDEAIKHCEEAAEEEEKQAIWLWSREGNPNYQNCVERVKKQRQLAEWLRELQIHREIHDVLLQLLVDSDLDICCEDLTNNEEEQKICEENCDNKTKGCWVRWAKLKAREVNADEKL